MAITLTAESDTVAVAKRSVAALARERLLRSGCRALHRVHCSHQGGTLFLTGNVSTYYLKQLAQEAVRETPGASEIVNRIEVSSSD